MNFDEWWALYWKRTNQPAIFDASMREIALTAWNAAIVTAANKVYEAKDGMESNDYGGIVIQHRVV